jgi:hypothetical protein
LWEGDGLAVYYKRLEKGTYEVPSFNHDAVDVSISYEALQHILQGVSLKSVRTRKSSRTSFMDQLKNRLIKRMDDSDENPKTL